MRPLSAHKKLNDGSASAVQNRKNHETNNFINGFQVAYFVILRLISRYFDNDSFDNDSSASIVSQKSKN